MWQRRLLFYRMKVETNFLDGVPRFELFRGVGGDGSGGDG
jgi:hypothetical protein